MTDARTVSRSPPRYGVARILSKRGVCSRSQAERWVREGRVRIEGRQVRDPQHPATLDARIEVDHLDPAAVGRVYLMLNKPRARLVTASDERGRDTVYGLLDGAGLPWVGPVGRLDKASEGLLLLSNDTVWAAAITDPRTHLAKTYHVQVQGVPGESTLAAIRAGVYDAGQFLGVREATLLRSGSRNAWLQIVLEQGRNRHIRRLLAALDLPVLRLVRVAIGPLQLGALGKGQWRHLDAEEVAALTVGRAKT